MSDTVTYLVMRRFMRAMGVAAALALALWLGWKVAMGGLSAFVMLVSGALVLLWVLFARRAWWIMLPVTLTLGGMFYFGFRIYTYELGLVLTLLPLIPLMALQKNRVLLREPLPRSLYILLLYFVVHLGVSEFAANAEGLGGMGNILRVYVRGLWPLVFAVPFYLYGGTHCLRQALVTMYVAAIVRSICGLLGYLIPELLYVPVLNFILPGGYMEGADLRESALWMLYLCLCFISLSRRKPRLMLHLLVAAFAFACILLGGGRASLGMACAVVLLWLLFQRRYLTLAAAAVVLAVLMAMLNSRPDLVYRFSPRVQRTLSILVLKSPFTDVHEEVVGSDEWHFELGRMGARRWAASPRSLAVGNRVYPFLFDFVALSGSVGVKMEVAAAMGSYESGLWTVLAVLGLVGASLYAGTFWGLLRPVLPGLLKSRICDYRSAFGFLAVASLVIWVTFSWIVGHFPSEALMLAVIAKAAYEDVRRSSSSPGGATPAARPGPGARRGTTDRC